MGADYNALSTILQFLAGDIVGTVRTAQLQIIDDGICEPTENVFVQVSSGGAGGAAFQCELEIIDNGELYM